VSLSAIIDAAIGSAIDSSDGDDGTRLRRARHFDGAVIDTIIIGTAVGPWSTNYADAAAKPSAPSMPR
jgi:hypothetical protein